jgi:hypothetical protein
MSNLTKTVKWYPTGNPSRPWAVLHEGQTWEVEVIDGAGEQPRYSLLIEGSRQEEFVDWQRAEYQREMERWERLKDVEPLDIDDIPEKP